MFHLCPICVHLWLTLRPASCPITHSIESNPVKASQGKNFQPTVQSPVSELLTTQTEKQMFPPPPHQPKIRARLCLRPVAVLPHRHQQTQRTPPPCRGSPACRAESEGGSKPSQGKNFNSPMQSPIAKPITTKIEKQNVPAKDRSATLSRAGIAALPHCQQTQRGLAAGCLRPRRQRSK